MQIEIVKLGKENVNTAKDLFYLFQMDDEVKNPTEVSDKYLENLLAREDFHVIAAIADRKVVGGLTAYELAEYKRETAEMFLYELVVEKTHRRQGIAKSLIEFLIKICDKKDIKEMFLATETDNEPAKKLYELTGGKLEITAIYNYRFYKSSNKDKEII